jgi:hypothetical protein
VTDAPELLSASFVSQQTATTTVKFTFDSNVTGKVPDVTKFHLYTNTGTVGTIYTPTAGNAQVSTADNNSVVAVFPTTAAQFASITLATVEADAVRDATAGGGKANPEGDAALGAFSASAGQTAAPDLVSVGNYRADATGSGMLVDLTFDANAFPIGGPTVGGLGATTYDQIRFVFQSSSSDLALADDISGQGTKVITAHISDIGGGAVFDANSTTISNLALARVYVKAGFISDGAGVTMPLEKANAGGNGITTSPDLVSASFNTTATNNAGTAIDQVTYTFDEPITVTDATKFQVFNVDASTVAAAASSATLSSTSNKAVVVNFADGALGSAVGANVLAGAVTGTTGSALANVPDEAAVSGVSFQAGRTAGPDLIGAVMTNDTTDPFSGAVTGYALTYSFDEALSGVTAANFKVYGGTTGTNGAAYLAGNGTNCSVTISSTDNTKVVLKGCTGLDGKALLSPNNSFLHGGFKLATVTRNAVTALDAGASNPEGAEPISGP